MKGLKLYVWEDYGCDYTCGIAFAIAESPEEAKQMIIEKEDFADKKTLANEPLVFANKKAFAVWGGG